MPGNDGHSPEWTVLLRQPGASICSRRTRSDGQRPCPSCSGTHQAQVEDWEQVISTRLVRLETSEECELGTKRAQLAEPRAQLTQREPALQILRAQLRAFEARYLHLVVTPMAELDRLQAELVEALVRTERVNPILRKEARRTREQAGASARAVRDATEVETRHPARTGSV